MGAAFAHSPLRLANRKSVRGPLWSLLAGMGIAALAGPAAAGPSGEQPSSAALSRDQASLLALPTTRDHIGRVVVQASVNGKGPFRFIVDTGATHSTITPDLVRALGLKPADLPTVVLNGITGTTQVSAVNLDTLQTGDLTIDGVLVPVVSGPIMAGADGIFGAAGLTEKSLSVDFLHNRVEISGGVQAAVRAQALRIHATRVAQGLMVLAMQVGGVHALAVIDTGSERTLGNLALRDALSERRRPGTVAQVTSVYGATAQVERGEICRAPTISIDSLRINDVQVVYGDFHVFRVWDMQEKPAMIIGMDVLGTLASLGIDFKNQVIYISSSVATSQTNQPTGSLASPNQIR
ncbi:MAG TPA: retroviral-like aspartic protease family protein [Steroidobacteraceae bacterium]